jgi:diadenosine tetraphosphate (Ap4A) HIT family hydrolase
MLLDILPLRAGHALVIPKFHCSRISDLPEDYAAAVGIAVSKVAKAITIGKQLILDLG